MYSVSHDLNMFLTEVIKHKTDRKVENSNILKICLVQQKINLTNVFKPFVAI
jgi:hypothetical protein